MKNKTKIITSLLGVSAFMALAVMGGFAKGQKQQFTPATLSQSLRQSCYSPFHEVR